MTPAALRFVAPDPGATRIYATVPSPFGEVLVVGDGHGVTRLSMPAHDRAPIEIGDGWREDPEALAGVVGQLDAYFAGDLEAFGLDLAVSGTPFQMEVWGALAAIPYGRTTSYGRLAQAIGRPTATRAVGAANGQNPVPIILPCHRVVGAAGQLTGYGLGIDRKHRLLQLEGAVL